MAFSVCPMAVIMSDSEMKQFLILFQYREIYPYQCNYTYLTDAEESD